MGEVNVGRGERPPGRPDPNGRVCRNALHRCWSGRPHWIGPGAIGATGAGAVVVLGVGGRWRGLGVRQRGDVVRTVVVAVVIVGVVMMGTG